MKAVVSSFKLDNNLSSREMRSLISADGNFDIDGYRIHIASHNKARLTGKFFYKRNKVIAITRLDGEIEKIQRESIENCEFAFLFNNNLLIVNNSMVGFRRFISYIADKTNFKILLEATDWSFPKLSRLSENNSDLFQITRINLIKVNANSGIKCGVFAFGNLDLSSLEGRFENLKGLVSKVSITWFSSELEETVAMTFVRGGKLHFEGSPSSFSYLLKLISEVYELIE